MKPFIDSVEVHPQLSYNGHPVDSALVGANSTSSASQPASQRLKKRCV